MKICYVHEEYPEETNFGGIATYQKQIAEQMVKLGHTVYVVTRALDKNKYYEENGVKVIRIYQEKSENVKLDYIEYRQKVKKVLDLLESNNCIDVIETPDWGAETIYYLRKENRKVPIVLKLHTPLCVWQVYNKNGLDPSINSTMLLWEQECMKSANKVISCSKLLLEQMEKQNEEIKNVEVIPNVIDTSGFYLKEPFHQSNVILFCGSIEERKGVLTLAKAINIIFKDMNIKDVNFLFVGKDTKRNEKEISTIQYIKEIIDSKYHDNIEFLGQLTHDSLNKIMNESCIGVVPSLFDNFPYVALEEMTTGLPLIVSDNTGIKEIVKDQESAILFQAGNEYDLAEKIVSLYNDSERRKKIGTIGKNIVNEVLSNEKIVSQMIEIYKEVINENK